MGMPALQLDKMSVQEKLRTIEKIWDDLQRRSEDVPVPSWHQDVLKEREKTIEDKSTKFVKWEQAKERIREQTR